MRAKSITLQTQLLLALSLLSACGHGEYDISRGVDTQVTLFTDEISLPIADIGPITPKQLLGDVDLGETLGGMFKEDGDGYLVVEKEDFIYSNPVLLLYMGVADPTQPSDVSVDDYSGTPGESLASLAGIGLVPALQEFCLYAVNPFTEEIAVSGRSALSSEARDDSPSEVLVSEEFTKETIPAQSDKTFCRTTVSDGKPVYGLTADQMMLHLPASFLEKDPLGGFGSVSIGYRYKAYLALGSDFPEGLTFPVNNLDLPLGQYKVKEARIRTEVSNEIPLTLVLENIDVLVKEADDEGNEMNVVCEDVSITPGLTVLSGASGSPAVTPLEIVIKAKEGTIPDIAGLQFSFSVKAPAGVSDKRLNMNQSVYFNNVRATVYGGITL